MKVLGLMLVRNGEDRVARALDALRGCCDEVYAIDDRSPDQTTRVRTGFSASGFECNLARWPISLFQ